MKIQKSKNYRDGKFQNLVYTRLNPKENEGMWEATKESFFGDKKKRVPQKPIKTIKFDKKRFEKEKNAFSWFGHSTLLLKIDGKTIVSDPLFGRSSPVSFMGPKPFMMTNPPTIEDLPNKIDLLLITHDHFDHLESRTIKKIHKKVNKFFVPLGVKKILLNWKVPENKIVEFDWYDSKKNDGQTITFTPARHFSGRSLSSNTKTIWGGWIIKSKTKNIFISGDSGYFEEFKKIGKKYGPFDIMFVENGQYDKAWIDIHMYPEQSVQASIESKAKLVMPTHWAKYDLGIHPWKEPIKRFVKEAKNKKVKYTTPLIGEIQSFKKLSKNEWWK